MKTLLVLVKLFTTPLLWTTGKPSPTEAAETGTTMIME